MSDADAHVPNRSRQRGARKVVLRTRAFWRRLRELAGTVVAGRVKRRIQFLIAGPVFFQTLRTACDLDLFALLRRKPGLTLQEIAGELRIDEYPARVLLMGCVALGLLRKVGPRYRCFPLLTRPFERDNPSSLVPVLEWMHHIVYPSMFHYAEAVRQCRPAGLQVFPGDEDNLYQRLAHDPRLETVFHEAMGARSRLTNPALLESVDFSGFQRVLDVGGGDGENLLAIARRYPSVEGTLFDLPTVAEKAASRFAEQGMGGRLKAVGGNLFEGEFPAGHDAVLFCHFTPSFSPAANRNLMRRAYAALRPGGMVCVYAPLMNDAETGPLHAAMISPYFLCTVNGQGRLYSWRETSSWLEEAGFVGITRVRLALHERAVLGFKP